MDLQALKKTIDINSDYEKYKREYEYRKKELKRKEIKKMFRGFKSFFKKEGGFSFTENEHSITADYKKYGITLDIDKYKNTEGRDFYLEGIIKTFDKNSFEFYAEAHCNTDIAIENRLLEGEERKTEDIRFFKEFIEGDVQYTFRYRIKGREEVYENMEALMAGL